MADGKPLWATDPDITERRRAVFDELERATNKPITPDTPDPVLADLLSGESVRELGSARDAVASAQARYADAVQPRTHLGGRLLA